MTQSEHIHGPHSSQSRQRSQLKISFAFAYPPPRAMFKKLKLRPRLILQVQQVSASSRPTPVLDVLRSTSFGRRMAPILPLVFRGDDGLASSDLVVIRSASYERTGGMDDERKLTSEEEASELREVIATICPASDGKRSGKRKPEIRFRQGLLWEARSLPRGSYDFVATDEGQERTVRWVRRRKGSRNDSPNSGLGNNGNKLFAFSIINTDSRRHPIIARLTRASIEVVDHCQLPTEDRSSSSLHTSRASDSSTYDSDFESLNLGVPDMATVSEELRSLILVTGSWVAMKEGWAED